MLSRRRRGDLDGKPLKRMMLSRRRRDLDGKPLKRIMLSRRRRGDKVLDISNCKTVNG